MWPSATERTNISEKFGAMRFPDIIECIDGTHVRIDTPKDDAESYLNRKKYYSVQVYIYI